MTIPARDVKAGQATGDAAPLAWWKCDEPSGAVLNNATGNKYPGAIIGAAKRAQSDPAHLNALELDGRTSWAECQGSSDIDFSRGVAASVWFKVRKFDRTAQTLLSKGNAWRLQRKGDSGTIEFSLAGPVLQNPGKEPATVASKRKVDDGQWHQVVVTYDGAQIALYLDGILEESRPASGAVQTCSALVTLGENDFLRGRTFNGWMDEVRLYNHGLNDSVIKTLMIKESASLK